MKQKFRKRLLDALQAGKISIPPKIIIKGMTPGKTTCEGDTLEELLKVYTLKKTGNKTSQGPNRRTRRKMWKSIQRPSRNSWLEDYWKYAELQPVNKPVRWEVAGVL